MIEEKLAEEYVKENAYTHSHEAIRQAFIAGYKAGKDRIKELEKQNSELKIEVSQLDSELREKFQIIHDLREQLPKWHKVADGDLPTYGKWIVCKMKDSYNPYIVSLTDAINDGVFLTGYETEETNGFENVIAWCEIPKYEEANSEPVRKVL